jgi:hypothetical protein
MRRRSVAACVSAALFACGEEQGPIEVSGVRAAALYNAELSSAGTAEDAVVVVRAATDPELLCTGTLVAANVVVTARHCVAEAGPELGFRCSLSGELVESPDGSGELGADLPASLIEIYSGVVPSAEPVAVARQIVSSLSPTLCRDDLAFVVLDRALSLPTRPLRLESVTRVDDRVTLIGYGRRLADQRIIGVGPNELGATPPEVRVRVFELEGPAACYGDSGAPALDEASGAVVGVYSALRGSTCTELDAVLEFTHLAAFEELAIRAFDAAGATLLRETEADPPPVPSEPCTDSRGCSPAPQTGSQGAADTGCSVAPRARVPANSWSWLLPMLIGVALCARQRTR